MRLQNIICGLKLCALSLLLSACTSMDQERIPGEEVMHFPFSMLIKDHHLLVSSQSSDRKYSFGRLAAIDTRAVAQALKDDKTPRKLPYKKVVTANTLIARDSGLLGSNDYIVFASRQNNFLYAVLRDQQGFRCNEPMKELRECPDARELKLDGDEPFSLEIIKTKNNEEKILVTYLSSDRLDLIDISSSSLTKASNRRVKDIIKDKLGDDEVEKYRFTTRKVIAVNADDYDKARLYFLFEKYKEKKSASMSIKGNYLASIKLSDYLEHGENSGLFTVIDLKKSYGINSSVDIHVDEQEDFAYVLARIPESLFKIDLRSKASFTRRPVCTGVGMLAVSRSMNRIFLPCFNDNKIISLGMTMLDPVGVTDYQGRGPAYISIDDVHKRIFVSYNLDGKVAIFDLNLALEGHIFNEAKQNSLGS